MFEDPSYKGMYLVSSIRTGIGAKKELLEIYLKVPTQQKYTVIRRCTKMKTTTGNFT